MLLSHRIAGMLFASFVACSAACRAPKEAHRAPSARVHDDFGTPIAVGATPQRIVSLNPTTTEILVALGVKPRLVGRSQYDTFPDSVRSVPSLGIALRPSVEAILAVHPDLVVLYASEDNRPAYDRLRSAGMSVVAFKIDSIAQFQRDARLLGRLTGDSA
ncbi:MAG TPA: ABC transporter substrate-binding protein, partial [Gemmatimonadaceae bacterium]|nr:ABC transporter substrate-binding protein [Gemmatimonadaceae bacterium]